MTLFVFRVSKLLGPPAYYDGVDRAYWDCPQCGKGSRHFGTLPEHPNHRNRVFCHACRMKDDIHDLMRRVYGSMCYPRELADLERWKKEYEQLHPHGPDVGDAHTSFSPRGHADQGRCKRCSMKAKEYRKEQLGLDEFADDTNELADAVDALIPHPAGSEEAGEYLTAIAAVLKLLDAHDVHPLALATNLRHRVWTRKLDRDHLADCTDDQCDWRCCMLKRGWTPERIRRLVEGKRAVLQRVAERKRAAERKRRNTE